MEVNDGIISNGFKLAGRLLQFRNFARNNIHTALQILQKASLFYSAKNCLTKYKQKHKSKLFLQTIRAFGGKHSVQPVKMHILFRTPFILINVS